MSLFASVLSAPLAFALTPPPLPPYCARELVVLGAGQDAGAPQIGKRLKATPRLYPSSLAVIDREHGQRFLFDATPEITQQLYQLDLIEPPVEGSEARLGIDGVFLTHAHMGHYMGLAWFGREAANTQGVPVFAMPRMAQFLRDNGPWSQLVELGNIALTELDPTNFTVISDDFGVLPFLVPHRDEYSETVGFIIMTPDKVAIYLPDLDSWDGLDGTYAGSLEELVSAADYLFVDATFWDDNELEGRDMSEIPHPRIKATMDRLQALPDSARAKVHFIHMNHTNPAANRQSAEAREVRERGFRIAERGMRLCLSEPREEQPRAAHDP